MQTRFELSNKYVDIKADDEFLYVDLVSGKSKLKISIEDVQAIIRFMIHKIQRLSNAD